MCSIIDYTNSITAEQFIVEDLVDKANYLMSIRREMEDDLKELDARLDLISQELEEMGIEIT